MTNNHWIFCVILFFIMVTYYGSGNLRGYQNGLDDAYAIMEPVILAQKILSLENTLMNQGLEIDLESCKGVLRTQKVGIDAMRAMAQSEYERADTLQNSNDKLNQLLELMITGKKI